MKIAQRAQRIEPFYVMEVAKAASALAREVAHTSQPMIFLNIGEPDFTAPPLVQQAATRAIEQGRGTGRLARQHNFPVRLQRGEQRRQPRLARDPNRRGFSERDARMLHQRGQQLGELARRDHEHPRRLAGQLFHARQEPLVLDADRERLLARHGIQRGSSGACSRAGRGSRRDAGGTLGFEHEHYLPARRGVREVRRENDVECERLARFIRRGAPQAGDDLRAWRRSSGTFVL